MLPLLLSRRRWRPPFVLQEPSPAELAAHLPQFASDVALTAAAHWLEMSEGCPESGDELDEVSGEELASEVSHAFGEEAGEDVAFASLDLPAVQRAFERRLSQVVPGVLPAAARAQLEQIMELKLRAQFLVMAIANAAVVPAVRQACDLEIVRLLARQARADVLAAWKQLRSESPAVDSGEGLQGQRASAPRGRGPGSGSGRLLDRSGLPHQHEAGPEHSQEAAAYHPPGAR